MRRFIGDDVADFVVSVYQDDFGFVCGDFGFGELEVRHDDDDIAFLYQPGCSTVQTNHAAAAFSCNGIGFKTFAVVVVDDGDFFVGVDTCRV